MTQTTENPQANTPFGEELSSLRNFACHLADAAGDITLRYFREAIDVENKKQGAGFDPVTVADRLAEEVIRFLISKTFPEHGIIGEKRQFPLYLGH